MSDDEPHWSESETTDDWFSVESHDNLYAREESDVQYASTQVKKFAEGFPEYTIVVTGGPYRGHSVQYRIEDPDSKVLNLDFYSVRPGYDRLDEVGDIIRRKERLPDGEDDRGIEPWAVNDFDWMMMEDTSVEKIRDGVYLPSKEHGIVYAERAVGPLEGGQIPFAATNIVVTSGLLGTTNLWTDPDLETEITEPKRHHEYVSAGTLIEGEDYWTLVPDDDEEAD